MNTGEIKVIMNELATRAQEYQNLFDRNLQRFNLNRQKLLQVDAKPALKFIFGNFTFARAGGEQAGYSDIAVSSLGAFDSIPVPDQLWTKFEQTCGEKRIGPNRKNNEGVVKGFTSLAREKGNLFQWVKGLIEKTKRVEPIFLVLVKNKGIQAKIASFMIRDMVWLCGLEERVDRRDALYLQPIDRWIRRVAQIFWPEYHERVHDLIISKKISEACEEFGISGVKFNQGAWYFGAKIVKDENKLKDAIEALKPNKI